MNAEKKLLRARTGPALFAAALAAGALIAPAPVSAETFRADTSIDETHCRVVFSWSGTPQAGPSTDELPAAATHAGEAVQVAFDQTIDAQAVDALPARLPGCVHRVLSGERFVELEAPAATEFRVAQADGQVIVDIVKPPAPPTTGLSAHAFIEQVEEALDAGRLDTLAALLEHNGTSALDSRPLLAATAFSALKQRAAAVDWMVRAQEAPGLSLDEKLHLASLYLQLPDDGSPAAPVDRVVNLLTDALKSAHANRREEIVHTLLALKADAAVLPDLLKLANDEGGDWVFAYAETAKRLGLDDVVERFWAARAKMPDLSTAEKRDIGFLLLESNKPAAIEVFRELADTEPPSGENVNQFLFLIGPRPDRQVLDWLVARGRASQDAARAGWMRHLLDLDAAEDAAAVVAGSVPTHPGVLDVYLEALAHLEDGPAASSAIRRHLPDETRIERLEFFASMAEGLNEYGTAREVRLRILDIEPERVSNLKALGYAEINLKHWPAAAEYLKHTLAREDGDWEIHYHYAEVQFILENPGEARTHYAQALDKMKNPRESDFEQRVAQAKCLSRLGQKEASVDAFEGLLAERPRDDTVRVSYIAALMEQGNYLRAKEVLGLP